MTFKTVVDDPVGAILTGLSVGPEALVGRDGAAVTTRGVALDEDDEIATLLTVIGPDNITGVEFPVLEVVVVEPVGVWIVIWDPILEIVMVAPVMVAPLEVLIVFDLLIEIVPALLLLPLRVITPAVCAWVLMQGAIVADKNTISQ